MTTSIGIAVYDPRRLDQETFLAGFVARGDYVDFLLEKLRAMPEVAGHHIVIGPRGMGKTSLLRRLAIGIGGEEALRQRFIPLTFREEQYNVRALDAFWRNCGEALAEWCEAAGQADAAAELDRSLLLPAWHESDSAAAAFLDAAKKLGGRPVLFVDNLDLILDALGPEQNWELRRILQAPGAPVMFGAATQMLRQSADPDAAFYEFFHPHILDALSEDELLRCIGRLADARGEAGRPVRAILAAEPERIRTLHTLTGGNPRVLTLVYQLLERSESSTVFSDLEALLDQLTPYYKARVEEYQTDLQRAVIDAIALNWDPITSHDLGAATAVDVTTISPQLARLRRDGLVEEVQTSGARSGYQIVERFFNIWYLMRHGTRRTRQKIRWLTAFLTSFYAPAELMRMRLEASEGRSKVHPWYQEALEAAGEALFLTKQEPFYGSLGRVGSRSVGFKIQMPPIFASEDTHKEAQALVIEATRLGELGHADEAIKLYDALLKRFSEAQDPEILKFVAGALINKGASLGLLGRKEEAIAVCDDVVARFEMAKEDSLREHVARALFNKGVTLRLLDRSEEAIVAYDEIVQRLGAENRPEFRELVAAALLNKGSALGSLGRSEEILVYDDLLYRFENAPELELCKLVACALFNKGVRLGALGRREDAIAVYDDLAARFGTAEDPILRERVACALVNKGSRLSALGRSEHAVAVYNDVIDRFGTAEEVESRIPLVLALVNKGFRLGALGRIEEAIAVCDDVVARFGISTEPKLREITLQALEFQSLILQEQDRFKEAEDVSRRTVRLFPDHCDAWIRLGNIAVDHLNGTSEAEAAYRSAMATSNEDHFAEANLAWLMLASGRTAEAAALRETVIDLHQVGLQLLDSAFELAADNFGAATMHLQEALAGDPEKLDTTFSEDLFRLLRLAHARSYGEKLISWFVESGQADRVAPVHAAFVAYVRGERYLLDFSPEVRKPAEKVYRWLNSHRLNDPHHNQAPAPKRRRGRPPGKSKKK